MTDTVAAVVVTYNRKQLLSECLKALLKQTRPVQKIFIIDNASTDGTSEFLKQKGYLDNPIIMYTLLPTNTGGAGGFYEGAKQAYNAGFDWLWLMDDDGLPETTCLEILLSLDTSIFQVLSPLVISSTNHNRLSFPTPISPPWPQPGHINTIDQNVLNERHPSGLLPFFASFFNGVLIRRVVIKTAGLPMRELFIWGDDTEYAYRLATLGIRFCTSLNAHYYHPENKTQYISFIRWKIMAGDIDIRKYCMIRNSAYINLKYHKFVGAIMIGKSASKYIMYYLLKLEFSNMALYMLATIAGIISRFTIPRTLLVRKIGSD